ncbi:MAG: hypothetical protein U0230_24950 [Polyangiales bacterium]
MITRVVISRSVTKELASVPRHVARKLQGWVEAVESSGLEEVRKVPGYHDEPLKGDRAGERSIRLSLSYRAIYRILKDGKIEFVSVEEVNKHKY